jgi:hypothetical protein
MTHRERILAALAHQETDHVPLDLGSSISTTLTARAHDRLRAYLGLPLSVPAPVMAKRASTVVPDEAILLRFDVDARPLLTAVHNIQPEVPPENLIAMYEAARECGS